MEWSRNPIVRAILAVGGGYMVYTLAGTFICPAMAPIDLRYCLDASARLTGYLASLGYVPHVVGSIAGGYLFYITGKWQRN